MNKETLEKIIWTIDKRLNILEFYYNYIISDKDHSEKIFNHWCKLWKKRIEIVENCGKIISFNDIKWSYPHIHNDIL